MKRRLDETLAPRRRRRLQKPPFPHACLRCGAPIKTPEEQHDHARLNLLGPNTCRKAAGKLGPGRKKRPSKHGRSIKDINALVMAGQEQRARWSRETRNGAVVLRSRSGQAALDRYVASGGRP